MLIVNLNKQTLSIKIPPSNIVWLIDSGVIPTASIVWHIDINLHIACDVVELSFTTL